MRRMLVLLTILMLFVPSKVVYASDSDSEYMAEEDVLEIAQEIGDIYNICPEFLQAIAFKESSYRPAVVNGDCKGLMQINDKWHKGRIENLGVTDLYDPYENMLIAADYLSELFDAYEEADVVLMFYNGNSKAEEYSRGIGEPSKYVIDILEMSADLEREHGK